MPKANTLGKNLHLCFSVIKCSQLVPHNITQTTSTSSPPNPQTLTNNNNNNYQNYPPPPTTPTTLTKTYNSLFQDSSSPPSSSTAPSDDDVAVGPATPDLTAVYASRRFFISSPGRSNSIVDSLSISSSSSAASSSSPEEVAGGVPVQTYSPDPYVDFRRSMQEMVEARDLEGAEGKEVWDYLQELLLSYLSLNPKSTHKYIVEAFADLVASLFISPHHHLSDNHINYSNN